MNHSELIEISIELIKEVTKKKYKNKSPFQISKLLPKKFKKLQDQTPPLFMGILNKHITNDNIHILKKMLIQKERIDNKEVNVRIASNNIADVLAEEYNVNFKN